MAGMPLAAMAAEHEDRNKVAAAQFKEQQQRPLGRRREANIIIMVIYEGWPVRK